MAEKNPSGEFDADQETPVEMPPILKAVKSSKEAAASSLEARDATTSLEQRVLEWHANDNHQHEQIKQTVTNGLDSVNERIDGVVASITGLATGVAVAAAASNRAADAVHLMQRANLQLVTTRESQALVDTTDKKKHKRSLWRKLFALVVAIGGPIAGYLAGSH